MKHTVYIGLGSNVGDRVTFLASAIRGIADFEMTVVNDVSDVYETEPVGEVPQDTFLNACIAVHTDLDVSAFHARIKELEKFIGRTVTQRWGPREIDIDILLYDAIIVNTDHLTVPHREIANRRFVLQPLSEIAMYVVHPVLEKTIAELLQEITDHHTILHSELFTTKLLAIINDSITNPTV